MIPKNGRRIGVNLSVRLFRKRKGRKFHFRRFIRDGHIQYFWNYVEGNERLGIIYTHRYQIPRVIYLINSGFIGENSLAICRRKTIRK
jgi:hypothetical protein